MTTRGDATAIISALADDETLWDDERAALRVCSLPTVAHKVAPLIDSRGRMDWDAVREMVDGGALSSGEARVLLVALSLLNGSTPVSLWSLSGLTHDGAMWRAVVEGITGGAYTVVPAEAHPSRSQR